ncbi:MAG: mandelate racemase/muconate lactonizing enzyme family protein [Candidatus Helarchaeota archaeon]
MKIKNYRIKIVRFPLNLRISKYKVKHSYHLILRIELDNNIYGYGEGTPYNASINDLYNNCNTLMRQFIGKTPNQCINIINRMYKNLKIPYQIDYGTILAISTALYDLIGKLEQCPICDILKKGKCKSKSIPITYIIGLLPRKENYIEAINYAKNLGIKNFKIKFSGAPEKDLELLKFLDSNFHNKNHLQFHADVNGNYSSFRQLIKFLPKFEKYGLKILEQPFDKKYIKHTAKLRELTDIKIMLDESFYIFNDLKKIIDTKACDIINLHPSKFGHLNYTRYLIGEIIRNHFEFSIGSSMMTNIGVLAYFHIYNSIPYICEIYEEIGLYYYSNYTITKQILKIKDGKIRIPFKNGLGIKINEKWLSKYAINPYMLNLRNKIIMPLNLAKNFRNYLFY